MLRPPTSLLSLLLPLALIAACQPLDPELDGFDQKSSDLISSFAMTAPRDATPFTQVYVNEGTGWRYGHKRPTQVRSVMVCMNTGWGTLPTLARLQDMMVSTQNYLRFSSQNRFQLGNTTFVGCGGATGTLNKLAASPIGWHARVVHEALEQARSQLNFDFAALDTNRDGAIMPDEALVTVMLGNTPHPSGNPRLGNPAGANRPTDRTRNFKLGSVNFVNLLDCSFQGVENTEIDRVAKYGTMAHEIMHQLFDAKDMYGMTIFGAGGDSLMDQHFDGSVLDPFHAIKLGWQNVRAYPIGHANFPLTMLNFGAAEIVVLYDPALMAKEYFLIENRSDQLLVWRIVEDVNRLNASPWIANVQMKGAVAGGEWGRHVIHKVATGINKAKRHGTADDGTADHDQRRHRLGGAGARQPRRPAPGGHGRAAGEDRHDDLVLEAGSDQELRPVPRRQGHQGHRHRDHARRRSDHLPRDRRDPAGHLQLRHQQLERGVHDRRGRHLPRPAERLLGQADGAATVHY